MGTVLNYRPRAGTVPAREACNLSEALETITLANVRLWYSWQRLAIRFVWGV